MGQQWRRDERLERLVVPAEQAPQGRAGFATGRKHLALDRPDELAQALPVAAHRAWRRTQRRVNRETFFQRDRRARHARADTEISWPNISADNDWSKPRS